MPYSYDARHSLRLQNYDYAQAGMYFVTICTFQRAHVLGQMREDAVNLNAIGHMVHEVWAALPARYLGVDIGDFIVMPNHVHGIVVLTESGEGGQARGPDPTMSLPQVIHRFKSFTTSRYRAMNADQPPNVESRKLWQRSCHDHIIRDDSDLTRIRQYIHDNPLQWHLDADNPATMVCLA